MAGPCRGAPRRRPAGRPLAAEVREDRRPDGWGDTGEGRRVRSDRLLQVLLGTGLVRLAAMLVRRPTLDVVLAVSPLAWRRWQRSLIVAVTLGAAGAGLVVFGIATGAVPAIVFGAIFIVVSWLVRVRAMVRWWVGVRYRPTRDEVVVSRVSAGFDDDARRLFTRAVLR